MGKISPRLLASLGLTDSEGRVYLAALELGSASIQALAQKSGVKRTSIYGFIHKLRERQILTETKSGKRLFYSAAHPQQLSENLRTRVRELESAMPELLAIYNASESKPSVTFHEGIEGIKEVYTDALRAGKPIYAWTDWEHMLPLMGEFLREYPKERARRGISLAQITRESPEGRRVAKRDKLENRESKFVSCAPLRTEIMIYGSKVAIMSFRSRMPFGLLIDDAGTAATLKLSWDQLWRRL